MCSVARAFSGLWISVGFVPNRVYLRRCQPEKAGVL